MTTLKVVRAWLHTSKRGDTISALGVFAAAGGAYSLFLATIPRSDNYYVLGSVDELYTVSSLILGVLFGCYSAFVMSRWWDLRVATGSVAGGIVNLSILLRGYLDSLSPAVVKGEKKSIESIGMKLKASYIIHISDILRSPHLVASAAVVLSVEISGDGSLYGYLSEVITQITQLSDSVKFSDAIKFSLLPSMQSEVLSIKSYAGDTTMMLNCRYPRIFSFWMYTFLALHMAYLPVYLMSKIGWVSGYYVASMAGFGVIGGFAVLVETHFRNPFKYDDFKLSEIISSTLNSVDELLDLGAQKRTKGGS